MKTKEKSVFSLVLVLALLFGVTTAFATSTQEQPDFGITDEEGNAQIFEGRLIIASRFSLDENGKYIYDPDSALNALTAESSIPPAKFNNFDNVDFNLTPEGTMNQQQDDLYYQPTHPTYTKAEMEQIIADIESGKIPGYKMSDFVEGKVPGFEAVEGAEWSVDFVDYPNSSCVLTN